MNALYYTRWPWLVKDDFIRSAAPLGPSRQNHAKFLQLYKVEPILKRIVAEAERVGLVRVWTHRNCPTWKMGRPLRFGEVFRVEVRDDDE
jgi:hypothetical protein